MKLTVRFVLAFASFIACGSLYADDAPRDVLESAAVFLDFGESDSVDVVAKPGFELGVSLGDSEKADSLSRGGDGRVARVARGAYATVSAETNAALDDISGRSITFGLRVKFSSDAWNDTPVASKNKN